MIGLCIPYKMSFPPQLQTSEMPNVATVLKSEMARVVRKEVRGETPKVNVVVGIGAGDRIDRQSFSESANNCD